MVFKRFKTLAAVVAVLTIVLLFPGVVIRYPSPQVVPSHENEVTHTHPVNSVPMNHEAHRLSAPLFQYSGPSPRVNATDGPLDPYAEKVFMMLKTGATVLRNRLPPHIRTTLQRWPHHTVYTDVDAEVCGVPVIDIIKWLPAELVEKHRSNLGDYFDLREAQEHMWLWELDELESYAGWHLDKYKNVPMLAHAWLNAPPDMEWFVFIDADTYVMQKGLLEHLKGYNHSEPHYIGRAADWEQGAWNKKGEWQQIPFAHGGSGVAVSRGAMSALFGADPHSDSTRMDMVLNEFMDVADPNIAGDALVAVMLFQYVDELLVEMPWGRYPFYDTAFQGSSTRDVAVGPKGWCLPYLSWHHLNPSEVDVLYEYEQTLPLSMNYVTYADIYRDFIMPFVVDELEGWNAVTYHHDGPWERSTARVLRDGDIAHSKEKCVDECKKDKRCVLWVFEDGLCQLELGVIYRGAAVNSKKKGFEKTVTSGWMIDRIRARRLESKCDPLHQFDNGTWSDSNGLSEGYIYQSPDSSEQSSDTSEELPDSPEQLPDSTDDNN